MANRPDAGRELTRLLGYLRGWPIPLALVLPAAILALGAPPPEDAIRVFEYEEFQLRCVSGFGYSRPLEVDTPDGSFSTLSNVPDCERVAAADWERAWVGAELDGRKIAFAVNLDDVQVVTYERSLSSAWRALLSVAVIAFCATAFTIALVRRGRARRRSLAQRVSP